MFTELCACWPCFHFLCFVLFGFCLCVYSKTRGTNPKLIIQTRTGMLYIEKVHLVVLYFFGHDCLTRQFCCCCFFFSNNLILLILIFYLFLFLFFCFFGFIFCLVLMNLVLDIFVLREFMDESDLFLLTDLFCYFMILLFWFFDFVCDIDWWIFNFLFWYFFWCVIFEYLDYRINGLTRL